MIPRMNSNTNDPPMIAIMASMMFALPITICLLNVSVGDNMITHIPAIVVRTNTTDNVRRPIFFILFVLSYKYEINSITVYVLINVLIYNKI